jgi:hypothetical protein
LDVVRDCCFGDDLGSLKILVTMDDGVLGQINVVHEGMISSGRSGADLILGN